MFNQIKKFGKRNGIYDEVKQWVINVKSLELILQRCKEGWAAFYRFKAFFYVNIYFQDVAINKRKKFKLICGIGILCAYLRKISINFS